MRKDPATPLARVLSELMKSAPYSGEEWGYVLGVSSAAVSQWRTGKYVPTPENLRAIARVATEFLGPDAKPIHDLHSLFEEPLASVTGRSKAISGSLGDYFVSPLFDAFQRLFGRLPVREKERVLIVASDVCHFPDKPHLRPLWPDIHEAVAAEIREILYGLSREDEVTQQEFLDGVRSEYFRTIMRREDPLADRLRVRTGSNARVSTPPISILPLTRAVLRETDDLKAA